MNWAQFKYPVSHMCLDGIVVGHWSLTQEVTGGSSYTLWWGSKMEKLGKIKKNVKAAFASHLGLLFSSCLKYSVILDADVSDHFVVRAAKTLRFQH